MMRFVLLGLTLGLIASLGALVSRQEPRYHLNLGFRNSITGEALVPSQITIQELNRAGSSLASTVKSDEYGLAQAQLARGNYRVTAIIDGYGVQSAETKVSEQTPNLIFNFDPPLLPEEADPEVVRKAAKRGAFTVAGFVVDDLTGRPIPGLQVGGVQTNERGAFITSIPLAGRPLLNIFGGDYGEISITNFETWPGGDIQLRLRAKRGQPQRIDLREERRRDDDDPMEHLDCKDCSSQPKTSSPASRGLVGPALPKTIRVGRDCATATTCTSVEVYSVQTYTARVLSSEWYGCWGSVAGGMDALRAGAVAVRSYGTYHVYNPRTSTYDICDTTSCQVFGSTTNTNSQNATNDTNRYVVTNAAGTIVRSEYSAENNNAGCGDGFTGTGTSTAPCISDPVCAGFSTNGHGRGLCQWGSARWATGKILSSSQACTASAPNTGQPTKDWIEILNHYYPVYNLVVGAEATLTSITANPNSFAPGATTALNYTIGSTADVNNVWLIATLSLNGSGPPITNTANQVRVNLATGTQTKTRNFATSSGITNGTYSAIGALHFDRDSSNTFNAGDFLMADGTFAGALNIAAPADPSTMLTSNSTGAAGSNVELRAVLRTPAGAPIAGKTVSFTVNGAGVGTVATSTHGLAVLNYSIPAGQMPAAFPLIATFAGAAPYQGSSDAAQLIVTRRP